MTENAPPPVEHTPPAPAPAPAPVSLAPDPEKQPRGYSAEYVKDLREETKGWRLKAQEQEQMRKQAEDAAAKALADAQAKLKEADDKIAAEKQAAQKAIEDRTIHAELRVAAIKAGMVDLDGLKLADMSALKVAENGEVEGVDALMATLKESKPYLFGSTAVGTSNPTPAPKPKQPGNKPALEMSDAEYKEKRRLIASGRPI